MTFGRWTVIDRAPSSTDKRGYPITMWNCRCVCGVCKTVYANSLLSGRSASCGCDKEHIREICKENFETHGESKTRLYRIWAGIKKRCQNPQASNYSNYGGRGIEVCSEWFSFPAFRDWALANGYSDTLTIDRIDVNGNYIPENCRWVTRTAQANNRRNSVYYEYNNQRHSVAEWAEILDIPYSSLRKRLQRNKCIEQIIEKYKPIKSIA